MKEFGVCAGGKTAYLYTIKNDSGVKAVITDFGAALVSLIVPDKNGRPTDIVLGFDTLPEYEKNPSYIGVTVGRYANRIVRGIFELEGREYRLDCNDGINHLHGGLSGFDKRLWSAVKTSENSVRLALFSPDMDQGYPGNVIVSVEYTLDKDALRINYCGMCDKTTVLNLTNHSYFNLGGRDGGLILDHYLIINAGAIAPVDKFGSVSGDIMDVSGTPFDFRDGKRIGADIDAKHEQLLYTGGYDHHYFLNGAKVAAQAYCEKTGICMSVYTDRPGIQFYSGNYLNDKLVLKGGRKSARRLAFCLETQYAPDSVNKPQFGDNAVLETGGCARHQTSYAFSCSKPEWVK
ncbi:MAG: aldose epimerase family protein [Christensenellales bacterium]